ncbi:head completion/stabilization protein [Histophilus somni]|uniref:head completion/stabilization protein n=1 Tax=Histophilus somni TaxID=731 RepID=UPI00201FA3CB|nr:head completion/stabilization protein [Histophilus somni]
MTVFIPHSDVEETEIEDSVQNPDPFYPNFSLNEFRLLMRSDDIITAARLANYLSTAAIFINHLLHPWRQRLKDNTLSAEKNLLYKTAVHHRAKTYILESYRDIDTTGDGEQRADAYEKRISCEQQREREAIRLLTEKKRTTISLV